MDYTLAERIKLAVGTGRDPTELQVLDTLDTMTATAAEVNKLAGVTGGTVTASKALVVGSNKELDTLVIADSGLKLGSGAGTAVTATAAELNYNDITTLGTGAASKAVVLDAGEDYTWPATGVLTGGVVTVAGAFTASSTTTLTGVATVGGIVQSPVFIADATPYTVLAANSGKVHFILEQTSTITLNLPVIAAGLNYKFVMGGVATEAQDWIFVATTPSFWNGGVVWADLNSVASNTAVVYGNGTSHLTFTAVTPAAGTTIEVYSNGTEWFLNGTVVSDSTPTMA